MEELIALAGLFWLILCVVLGYKLFNDSVGSCITFLVLGVAMTEILKNLENEKVKDPSSLILGGAVAFLCITLASLFLGSILGLAVRALPRNQNL